MSGILLAFSGGSYGSPPANTVAPAVTGTAQVRQTLSCSTGSWNGVPTPTFTYQWQSNSTNISGATSSTYQIADAYVGTVIRCVVTATNPIGTASANSNATSSVAANVPAAPTIGTATAASSSTATVAFTAPSGAYATGGSAITGYTVYSSGGQTATGASSPITVSGLTSETSYNFYVRANNAIGQSANSGTSNTITTSASYWIAAMDFSWSQNATKGAVVDGSGNITFGVAGNNAYQGTPTNRLNKEGTWLSGIYPGGDNFVYPRSTTSSYMTNQSQGSEMPFAVWPYSDGSAVAVGRDYPSRGASIERVDSSGNYLWGSSFPTGGYAMAFGSVMQDPSGYIIAAGSLNGYPPEVTPIVARYDGSGNVQQVKRIQPSSTYRRGTSQAWGDGSNVYVAITGRDYSATFQYGYAVSLSNSLTMNWSRRIYVGGGGGSDSVLLSGVTTDTSGNSYFFGNAYSTGDGNNHTGIVLKYNSSGTLQWQRAFKISGVNLSMLVSAKYDSSSGYLYCMGSIDGGTSQFFLKMDTNANIAYVRSMSNSSQNVLGALAAIPSGSNIYVYGSYNIPNVGPFVMKVPADGSKTGTYGNWTYAAVGSYSWFDRGLTSGSDSTSSSDYSESPTSYSKTAGTFTTTRTLTSIP